MNIRVKFNLVLISTFIAGLIATGLYYEYFVTQIMIDSVQNESKLHMQAALAIRLYTSKQVKPLLDNFLSEKFIPQRLPAFAARETMNILYKQYPNFSYREAVLNPTNPLDRAHGWEIDIIERYRSNKIKDEHIEMTKQNGQIFINVARPIKITDDSCLACHGHPTHAPGSVTKQYGNINGFGWKKNEIVGAQIVSLPLNVTLTKAKVVYHKFLWSLVGIFSLLFIVLNLLLGRVIIVPLHKDNMHLSTLAGQDPLTGALNRRAFEEGFIREIAAAQKKNSTLSLITFDLDHFKRINDQFGHEKGDVVLKTVCRQMSLNTKTQDYLVRLGGEEFAILLPYTTSEGAYLLAQSLCSIIAKEEIPEVGTVTASFGVATWVEGETLAALMERADKALYTAKHNGRNQVVRAEDMPSA